MVRALRGVGLAGACLVVMATAAVREASSDESSPGRAGRIVRVAQKVKTAKKKGRPEPAAEAKPGAAAPDTTDGTLKFSRDIAPIIVANCAECHIRPAKKRGDLDMSTFQKLMEGAKKEKVITPGNPEESPLVLHIRGDEPPKMPPGNNRNLSEEAIAKIELWVKSGALLDAGKDPKATLESYASSPEDLRKSSLAKMTPEQRDKQVETVALERWKKASPKTTPEVTPGTHFLLVSALPKARAAAALKKVEDQFDTVKSLVGPRAVEWGEKGTLFVFNDAGSFGEFVKANEKRDVESTEKGSALFSVPQPFVVVVDPLGGRDAPEPLALAAPKKPSRAKKGKAAAAAEEANLGGANRSLAGLLTEYLTIGTAEMTGKPPRWVTLGLGAFVSSRVEPGSPYYRRIRRDAFELCNLGWASKVNDALGDQEKTEVVRAAGFAILEWVAANDPSSLSHLVREMGAGGPKLDEAIGKVLNMSRQDFLGGSGEFVESRYGR